VRRPILFAIVATMLVGCGTVEQQAACLQVAGSRWNQPAYGQCLDRMTGIADNGLWVFAVGRCCFCGSTTTLAQASRRDIVPLDG
jgi:hypothetical protein